MKMSKQRKPLGPQNIFFFILVFGILMASIVIMLGDSDTNGLVFSDIRDQFEAENVKQFVLEDNVLYLELYNPINGSTYATYEVYSLELFYSEFGDLIEQQYDAGIIEKYDYPPLYESPWWVMFVPYLLIALLFLGVWYYMMNKSQGGAAGTMKFGKARTRVGIDEKQKVTFDDVAGADEEKAELQEIVEFLKNPAQFTDIGAKVPKGVLLVGPPGTGKTLLAKAVAGEAGVQFLSISGSDFVELYVGVGASRVRDLFDQAKKAAPAIIFIDEIDAVGRKRGAGLGGGHDEREQTLNQLLVEMDGFVGNEGVIVLAATNRADILDNALLRPGRFDRTVYVGTPDSKGREDILKVHAKGKPLAEDVDLSIIAKTTAGFTGADLQNLLNEAALLAARNKKRFITMKNIEDAMIKVIAGPEKKSRVVSPRERKLTAYHEAGHAVVMKALPTHDPVHQISIIPRGQAGGMTISLPAEDKSYASRGEMLEQIVSLLGGRVAEALVLDDISTGASNDIQRATAIARNMITIYGMRDKIGPVCLESGGEVFIGRDYGQTKSYSERLAAEIDEEISRIISDAYKRCEAIILENMDKLHIVAQFLLENETMSAEQFELVYTDPDALKAPEDVKAEEHAPEQIEASEPDEQTESEEEVQFETEAETEVIED